MCFPGTQCYIVDGGQPLISAAHSARSGPAPWYDKLWRSVQQADANPGTPSNPETPKNSKSPGK